jgi:predicted O-linked N-acetylglucosamine transferase (SPINDLY family)
LSEAAARLKAGDLAAAQRLCEAALAQAPQSADALQLAGAVAGRRGDLAAAERLFARAAAADPRAPSAWFNRGNALRALGRPGEALDCYDRALALKPDHASALGGRAGALLGLGRAAEAEAAYRRGVEASPSDAALSFGLGNALKDLGRLADAAQAFARAAELKPDYAEAHNNLGTTLKDLGRPDEAALACFKAAELRPNDAIVQDNLGAAYYEQGRSAETAAQYKRALRLKPGAAGASAWTLAAADALLGLTALPAIYPDEAAIDVSRASFAAGIERLKALAAERPATPPQEDRLIADCLFKLNHFLLAYQQRDDKPLLQAYCEAATALLKPGIDPFLAPLRRRPGGGKIRLGVASALLMNHNGVNWLYPWLAGLPPGDYEFFFYALNGRSDWLTEKFAALGIHRRLPFRADSFVRSAAAIRADALDVLILPDVGMTPTSRVAALLRLAPIQCASWGHPVTTGAPMIDYYLSSAAMEPPDAQAQYSETLVRLPGAGVYVHGRDPYAPKASREEYGLPGKGILIGSLQNPFKYLPSYDALYARIAAALPEAKIVFIGSPAEHVNRLFAQRLGRAFAAEGLDFGARAVVLPRQSHARFAQLFDVLDLSLDTPGWNGANTTALALQRGCPVASLPGAFMRGRHGVALLNRAGLEELVAPSPEAFVALAARLGADAGFRAAMGAKARRGVAALSDNRECCSFLDAFFKQKTAALA